MVQMPQLNAQGAIGSGSRKSPNAGPLHGQGATEYVILLAVVLVVSLVSIGLLGFFPNLSTEAKITQSNSYWRNEAHPFLILDHVVSGNTVLLTLQNAGASGLLQLNSVTFGGATTEDLPASFSPGQTKTITLTGFDDESGAVPGTVYEVQVSMTYLTPSGVENTEYGLKPLVGRYSAQ
jgi:hypothetical protein